MTLRALIAAIWIGILPAAPAQAQAAPAAAEALRDAAGLLNQAESASERVAAYTEVIRAYEAGLADLRGNLRETSLRRRALEDTLAERQEQHGRMIEALIALERRGLPQSIVHPAGPVSGLRAGLLLAEITPALEARARETASLLEEIHLIEELQTGAETLLETSLRSTRVARTELSKAIAERRTPDAVSATDAATMQALVNSADTLEGFAESLSGLGDAPAEALADLENPWPAPAPGEVLHKFGETGIDGAERDGVSLAVTSGTLVTSPTASTVRYAGELLDFGLVAILEPAPSVLIILAGLGNALVSQGDIVAEGDPIGWMPGLEADPEQKLIDPNGNSGQDVPETLYIEVRKGQKPQDPGAWLQLATETGNDRQ
ncbi:murein hydrolase activator EnvC family protein [Ovoidimarina sediminis]|uniref:murein hydrolase activator EnvC family protein n=1 Tax=Ovoidimarina sediminis TaxID=3079856 RepID=UPI0029144B21|nr:peptidoglycan DD-metalloendopeptidase family protein [Rhodophyticola sp. MJ-SS7]MDU8942560.1 peptidoglycan DD-metalloendopeptidase family protein [Rhodophyticola sp. MJ-SS7]